MLALFPPITSLAATSNSGDRRTQAPLTATTSNEQEMPLISLSKVHVFFFNILQALPDLEGLQVHDHAPISSSSAPDMKTACSGSLGNQGSIGEECTTMHPSGPLENGLLQLQIVTTLDLFSATERRKHSATKAGLLSQLVMRLICMERNWQITHRNGCRKPLHQQVATADALT